MTLDDILGIYFGSSESDWHQVSWREFPESRLYEAIFVYRNDVSVAVGWRLSEDAYEWDLVEKFPDPHARKFMIELLYNGVIVYEELAVSVDGGRADLPSPIGHVDSNDPASGWLVKRQEYDFVRQFSVMRGRAAEFDDYFERAKQGSGFTIE